MEEQSYPETVDLVWFIELSEWQETTCVVKTINLGGGGGGGSSSWTKWLPSFCLKLTWEQRKASW